MLHPAFDLRYISEEEGLGVVATRLVPKGTMTSVESDFDLVLTPAQMEQLDSAHQELVRKYGYRKPTGEFFLDWDHARFINHSFHNTEVLTTYEFGLAVRDVCIPFHGCCCPLISGTYIRFMSACRLSVGHIPKSPFKSLIVQLTSNRYSRVSS
jgi:hypothetical protein